MPAPWVRENGGLDLSGHERDVKEPEDWGSVLGARLERFADGQAVEGEGKKAVTEEGTVGVPTPLFLWGSGSHPRERACFPCLSAVCATSRSTRERKAVRMFSMLHFSPLKNELCSVT